MNEFRDKVFTYLQMFSNDYGTGDANSDALFVLVVLLMISGAIFTFTMIRTASDKGSNASRYKPTAVKPGLKSKVSSSKLSKNSSDGFDRTASILGKIERFEMEINATRTEMMRENALLNNRVEVLEGHLKKALARIDRLDGKNTEFELSEQKDKVAQEAIDLKLSTRGKDRAEAIRAVRSPSQEFHPEDILGEPPIVSDVIQEPSVSIDTTEEEAKSLSGGLQKTRKGLFSKIKSLFVGGPIISEEMLEEIQAQLISSDIGIKTVDQLSEELKTSIQHGGKITEEQLVEVLKEKVHKRLIDNSEAVREVPFRKQPDGPTVIMMIGVNGAGKTTTTAKIADQIKNKGGKVLLIAADTFRAAAVEQLRSWADRIDVSFHAGVEGAKPASVVYDGMIKAMKEDYDVVIVDTAGRLHTKTNLMSELEGIKNIIKKHQPSAPHESLLVLDGASGQNAISQAKEFNQSIPLTGLVITKLDGTPKGGIVVAIKDELGVPLRYIGVGEGTKDLKLFNAEEFVEALFDSSESTVVANSAHAQKRRRRRRDTLEA